MEPVIDNISSDLEPWENSSESCFTTTNLQLSNYETTILSAEIYEIIMAVMCWLMIPFLLFLGIPGNVVSAMVFYRQGLGERINVCLFLLALADLVNVVILLLVFVEDRVRKHVSPDTWFTITYLGGLISVEWASQLLSAVIACERCFCVVSPLHAKRLLKTSTMTAIVVVCCVVLMAGMCAIMIPKQTISFMYDPSANITRSLVTLTQYYMDNKKILDIFDIIIYTTVLPTTFYIVIGMCTTITAMKLNAAVKKRKSMTNMMTGTQKTDHLGSSLSSKEMAVTRMLIGTSVLFLICVMPNIGVQIFSLVLQELYSSRMYITVNFTVWYIVLVCRGVRSSVHFCVYYVMGSKFREYVHSLCRSTWRSSDVTLKSNSLYTSSIHSHCL